MAKSKYKKQYCDFECVANHLPGWIDGLDTAVHAVMPEEDYDRLIGMIDRYNDLIDFEEENKNDGNAIFGVEDEKEDLIKDIVKLYEKYKEEATKLQQSWKNSQSSSTSSAQ